MKIVINECYGGFSVNSTILDEFFGGEDTGIVWSDEFRKNSLLIHLIESRGSEIVSGQSAKLAVVNLPDNLKYWYIREYDGFECIVASESPILHFSSRFAS